MNTYVLAFRGQPDYIPTPDEEQQWGAWFASIGPSIADPGNRAARTTTVAADGAKSAHGVLTGYTLVTAESLDAAADLAGGCPGLPYGTSVEVAEIVNA